ncbi:MAG: folylpolyglutamate synthase/dihydrofolate synthase family protein [Lysobacteraceae bacterium]
MNLDEWLDYQQQQHPDAIALGLDRVREVARRLGLARPATRVITIAGTNGKGSTVAFIEAIARDAGLHVGSYTSPHLLRYNERILIDGIEIDDAALIAAFERIETARISPCPNGRGVGVGGERGDAVVESEIPDSEGPSFASTRMPGSSTEQAAPLAAETIVPLTYFEFGTLAALLLLQEANLDLAILEVGLGGRLDAVNIVDADVAIITTVDLDHQDWLGDDRETIGMEKAGVMRAGKPVVLGEADPPASVLRHAYRIGANAIRAGCDYFAEPKLEGWRWHDPSRAIALPNPILAVPAQRANAAAAIAALRALEAVGLETISDVAIAQGVATASAPARMQRIVIEVAGGQAEVIVDVAHNPQAAHELARGLAAHPVDGATDAIFSALGDKDLPAIVGVLVTHIRHWTLCGLDSDTPRGLTAEQLRHRVHDVLAQSAVTESADVASAMQTAIERLRDGDRLLIFGSFFTAAAALRWLDRAR